MTQATTNTYAINTTKGKEFVVQQALTDLGLQPWLPLRLTSKNIKEKKTPIWYDLPYIPKLMFCVIPAIYYRDVLDIKHVIGKPEELSRRDIDGCPAHVKKTGLFCHEVPGLRSFRAAVEAEYHDMERRRQNNEYQCLYRPGQALEMISGNFEGMATTFKDAVKRAHDEYAKLRVEVEMFGRIATIEVSPDMVKAY